MARSSRPSALPHINRVPNYKAPKARKVTCFVPARQLPDVCDYYDLVPRSDQEEAQQSEVRKTLVKSYAEAVHPFMLLRLFFFVFHAHVLLFVTCFLLNVDTTWDEVLWIYCAEEAVMVLMRSCTLAVMLQVPQTITKAGACTEAGAGADPWLEVCAQTRVKRAQCWVVSVCKCAPSPCPSVRTRAHFFFYRKAP